MRCDEVRPCKRCIRAGKQTSCSLVMDTALSSENIFSADSQAISDPFSSGSNLRTYDSKLITPSNNQFPQLNRTGVNDPKQKQDFRSGLSLSVPFNQARSAQQISPSTELFQSVASQYSSQGAQLQSMIGNFIPRTQSFAQQLAVPIVNFPGFLEQQRVHQQGEIRALLGRMQPRGVLDNLLFPSMLGPPESAGAYAALDTAANSNAILPSLPSVSAAHFAFGGPPPMLQSLPSMWTRHI